MSKHRYLFASVDSHPRIGGVSLLAQSVSAALTRHHASEAVYVGPKGTYFPRGEAPFKLYEDFHSDTRLRAGEGSRREDSRIADLFSNLIKQYALNQVVVWHPFYYGLGALQASKRQDVPCCVFVHGTELTSQIEAAFDSTQKFTFDPESDELNNRLYQTLREADQILTNSSYSASLICNIVPDAEVIVVGCGIEQKLLDREISHQPTYQSLEKTIAREDLSLPERKTLVQLGRLVRHKNHQKSIDLIAASEELQLVIIGDGPCREELAKYIEAQGAQDRVFLKGQVDEDEKWRLLRASDAGLLISDYDPETGGYEGFGIAMVEYAAAGNLVLSTGGYGMSDFAKRYKAAKLILHDDSPVAEHAKSVELLLQDEPYLQKQVEYAREVIERRFTWRSVADRTARALSE
jgi:glycosyltransferase involved in cell wall biosynthesis